MRRYPVTWSTLQDSSRRPRIELPIGMELCLLPGPRRRSRVSVRQAAQTQQTLIRNPAKGEQGSESPQPGPAKPRCMGFAQHPVAKRRGKSHRRLLKPERAMLGFPSLRSGLRSKSHRRLLNKGRHEAEPEGLPDLGRPSSVSADSVQGAWVSRQIGALAQVHSHRYTRGTASHFSGLNLQAIDSAWWGVVSFSRRLT